MNKKVLSFIVLLLLIVFKYLEMWVFLLSGEYYKSLFILFIVVMATLFVLASTKKKNFNLIKVIAIAALCAAISFFTSTSNFMVALVIALVYYDKTKDNVRSLIRNFVIVSAVCYVVTIFMYYIGILPAVNSIRVVDGDRLIRNSLGFFNANSVLSYFSSFTIAYLGLTIDYSKKKKVLIVFLISIIIVSLYFSTYSRTGLLVMIVALLLYIFNSLLKTKLVKILLKEYILVFLVLSFVLAIVFGQNIDNPVNQLLTNRPYFWFNGYVQPYGLTLTGKGVNENALDNAYLYLFYSGGIVSTVIYYILSKKSSKYICNDPMLLYILSAVSLYGLAEQNINYCMNVMVIIQVYYCISDYSDGEGGKIDDKHSGKEFNALSKR